ncbi:MAG: 1-aminocyclopropane-1-carboxylate deaminase [Verrucomicrobiales bacterium]|jgi:1-aminocyclopropane-1-carboxylate deaminase
MGRWIYSETTRSAGEIQVNGKPMPDRLQLIRTYFEHDSATVESVTHPVFEERGLELHVQREDTLGNGLLSGNKFRKLKYNLFEAAAQKKEVLLSFGGGYSNHIIALAAAGLHFGFKTIGIIRGEQRLPLNPALAFASDAGMELHYIDRATYRNKAGVEFENSLREKFGDFFLIPEGGTNSHGVRGTAETLNKTALDFDVVCCPVGTGGTLAGVIAGLRSHQKAIGISVLKGCLSLNQDVRNFLAEVGVHDPHSWEINHDFHFGGYGKKPARLLEGMAEFESIYPLRLEHVYTGKLFLAICEMAQRGDFARGSKILIIYTWSDPIHSPNSTVQCRDRGQTAASTPHILRKRQS